MTKQKQLIYDIIMASSRHMTAEEIYDLARERMPSMARGTVYRNLGILEEEGKIRRLEMPSGPARYDRDRQFHPHLICEKCGKVEDLILPDGMLRPLGDSLDTEITGYDLRFFHVCVACAAQQESLDP